jgi:hypothetical protein
MLPSLYFKEDNVNTIGSITDIGIIDMIKNEWEFLSAEQCDWRCSR